MIPIDSFFTDRRHAGGVRPNVMIHTFDAEHVAIVYVTEQREPCARSQGRAARAVG